MAGVRWFIEFVTRKDSKERVLKENEQAANEAAEDWRQSGQKGGKGVEDGLSDGARKGRKKAEQEGGRLTKFFKGQFGQLATMFAGIFAFTSIARFTRELVTLGMAGGETAAKFRITFGEAREEMEEFLEGFSTMAGLSKNEGEDAAATIAAMGRGMGFTADEAAKLSQQVLTTAGDLTAFNDVPIEQTIRAVRSAIVGEREALKTLGVVVQEAHVQQRAMEMSGKRNADALTQQEKAAATLALIMERMGPAQGALVREADSLSAATRSVGAAWKTFKEVLGETLVSGESNGVVMVHLRDTFVSMTEWVKTNAREIRMWAAGTVAVFAALIRTVTGAVRMLKNMYEVTLDGIIWLASKAAVEIMDRVNNVITSINGLTGIVNRILPESMQIGRIALLNTQHAANMASAAMEEMIRNSGETDAALMGIVDGWVDIYRAIKQAGEEVEEVVDSTKELDKTAEETAKKLAELLNRPITPRLAGASGARGVSLNIESGRMVDPGIRSVDPLNTSKQTYQALLEAMSEMLQEESRIWEQTFRTAAYGMVSAWEDAFSLLFEDFRNLGAFVEVLARQMTAALIGSVADYASTKVAENIAEAFENFAKAKAAAALAVTYPPAAAAAGLFQAAARGNLVSAAKWAVVAGGAGAAAGAVGGGSGGSGGGRAGGRVDRVDENRRSFSFELHVDGIDPDNPRHQDLNAQVIREAKARHPDLDIEFSVNGRKVAS